LTVPNPLVYSLSVESVKAGVKFGPTHFLRDVTLGAVSSVG